MHLQLHGKTGRCDLLLGRPLASLPEFVPQGKPAVIITDENVLRHLSPSFPSWPVVAIPPGEMSKNWRTVLRVYRQLLELEVDRHWFLAGIGGGVVCDITGFVASTFLRGLDFGFAPTTLLAQADAAVGGKNGINFLRYKNLIGTFRQPAFVLCDPQTLRSLPVKAVRCGMAEIIKAAAIADIELFDFLEKNLEACLRLDERTIAFAVEHACRVKIEVVRRDELEAGERRKLNFGHTVGHALEAAARLDHGEAVAIGMAAAARLSVKMGLLDPEEERRLVRLLREAGLPVIPRISPQARRRALLKDKKRESRNIHFVCLAGLGQAVVKELSPEDIIEVVHDLR